MTVASRVIAVPSEPTSYISAGVTHGPLIWPTGHPTDYLRYGLDFSGVLQDGDEFCKAFARIRPSGPGERQIYDLDACGQTLTLRMQDGVPGRLYTVELAGETRLGDVVSEIALIFVSSELSTWLPPDPPCSDFGDPIMWPSNAPTLGPVKNLPPFTVAATGTTQLTAAPVPYLAVTLINAGIGTIVAGAAGCVQLAVPIAEWGGNRPVFANRSGNPVMLFLYGSDSFEQLSPAQGTIIQDDQTVTLSASLGGAAIIY